MSVGVNIFNMFQANILLCSLWSFAPRFIHEKFPWETEALGKSSCASDAI